MSEQPDHDPAATPRSETGHAAPARAQTPASPGGTSTTERPNEVGGRAGPDPTRYGDWEKNGRCIDF